MDQSKAKAIVLAALPRLRWAMQLQEWRVNIFWGPISDPRTHPGCTSSGRCGVRLNYREADIEIDPAPIEDEKELMRVFRHEMLHIFHAEMETHHQQVESQLDDAMVSALVVTRSAGHESIVRLIENMLDHGLGLDAEAMMDRSRAYENEKAGAASDPRTDARP